MIAIVLELVLVVEAAVMGTNVVLEVEDLAEDAIITFHSLYVVSTETSIFTL